jgi:L-alanine-DL-glutamate epimerase-like enolase superfamily enzyme
MIVNRKTLTDLNACSDGLEWFDRQKDKELSTLVLTAIEEGGESLNYAGWGLCAVMTKEQRVEWAISCAYTVAHLWKDKHPKEFAIWDKWASGRDRSTAARAAARAAARVAAWDDASDAKEKTLAKLLRKGVAIVYGSGPDREGN